MPPRLVSKLSGGYVRPVTSYLFKTWLANSRLDPREARISGFIKLIFLTELFDAIFKKTDYYLRPPVLDFLLRIDDVYWSN